jgi:hypothetical protein
MPATAETFRPELLSKDPLIEMTAAFERSDRGAIA